MTKFKILSFVMVLFEGFNVMMSVMVNRWDMVIIYGFLLCIMLFWWGSLMEVTYKKKYDE